MASPVILTEVRDNLVAKIGVTAALADDAVLGTAVAAGCDLIVTGERDLLDLQAYENISIVSRREFWKREFLSRNGE